MPAASAEPESRPYSPEATASLVYGTILDSKGSHESWETLRNAALRLLIGEKASQERIRATLAALRQHAIDEVFRSIERCARDLQSYDAGIRDVSRGLLLLIDSGHTPRPGHHIVQRLREQLTQHGYSERALARYRAILESFEAVEVGGDDA